MAAPVATALQHKLASINGFFLDCLLSDNHQFDADITEFPVEDGSSISDNIRNKPLIVTMECLVTNSPIGQLVTLRDKNNDPLDSAYDFMLKIRSDRQLVSISTSLRTYDNMALQSLSIPRKSGRSDDLEFTAVFKQVELVVNKREKRVAIVGAKGSGATRTSTGAFDDSQDSVYVYLIPPTTMTWYDRAISGWRSGVDMPKSTNPQPNTNGTGSTFQGTPGIVQLFEGVPEDLGDQKWLALTDAQRHASNVQPLIVKAQGAHAGRPLFGKEFRSIIQLMRGSFTIFRGF